MAYVHCVGWVGVRAYVCGVVVCCGGGALASQKLFGAPHLQSRISSSPHPTRPNLTSLLRRMQEDAADALAGYPRSHLEAVADFLAGQFQRDVVGPLLGPSDGGSGGSGDGGAQDAAAAAAAASGGSMLDRVMEVLGRQALVQAADSSTGASPKSGGAAAVATAGGSAGASSGGPALGQLLAGLQAACAAAFNRTSQVISPTLALTGSLALGPTPCALAAGYLPGGVAAAVAWEGQAQVLLLRGVGGDEEAAAEAPEAALLALPEGAVAVDLAFYKNGQLAMLLAGSAGGAPSLVLLPQEQLQWVQLPTDLLADSDVLALTGLMLESAGGAAGGTPLPKEGARQRLLPYPRAQAPLAVSASRGVGCVLAGTQVGAGGPVGMLGLGGWMGGCKQTAGSRTATLSPLSQPNSLSPCCFPFLHPAACDAV